MPQFDPAVWPTQLFWLAVLFVILLVVMAKFALPPIAGVLEEREARIDERLRRAEHLRLDAEEAAAAYESLMASARAEAHALVQQARDKAQEEATARNAVLTEKLQAQLAEAEARIAAARDKAMGELATVAVDLVSGITERLLGEPFERAAVTAAVTKVMKERA